MWQKLWGFVTGLFGGGGIVSAVDDTVKLADHVVTEVHDHNQVVAGENKVIAQDNAEKAKANEAALQAVVDNSGKSVSGSLRDGSF